MLNSAFCFWRKKKKAMFAELRLQMSQALILMRELGKHLNFVCQLANWDSDNN